MNVPADWLGLYLDGWHVIEIKNPDKLGYKYEFTKDQKEFNEAVKNRGGKVLIWRTDADVFRDSRPRIRASSVR